MPLNTAILVAMGTSFILGVIFCLFVLEATRERITGIITGLGLVALFSFNIFIRMKLILGAIPELFACSSQTSTTG